MTFGTPLAALEKRSCFVQSFFAQRCAALRACDIIMY
jgi:hypothetical protein